MLKYVECSGHKWVTEECAAPIGTLVDRRCTECGMMTSFLQPPIINNSGFFYVADADCGSDAEE